MAPTWDVPVLLNSFLAHLKRLLKVMSGVLNGNLESSRIFLPTRGFS